MSLLEQDLTEKHIDYHYANRKDFIANEQNYSLSERPPSEVLQRDVYGALAQLDDNTVVLNLGCGDGNFERHAPSNRPYGIIAIDQDAEAIDSLQGILDESGKAEDRAIVGNILQLDSIAGLEDKSIDAAISWRVVHGLPPETHEDFFRQVHAKLVPGGHFYVAVLSDKDWKRGELEATGEYKPGEVNETVEVMKFAEHGLPQTTWPLFFFSEDDLVRLALNTGFRNERPIETFNEPTGFPHLAQDSDPKRREITYHFADFKKLE